MAVTKIFISEMYIPTCSGVVQSIYVDNPILSEGLFGGNAATVPQKTIPSPIFFLDGSFYWPGKVDIVNQD